MTLWRMVPEYEKIPRAYGLAWHDPVRHYGYFLPKPLNWIVGGFRNFWLGLNRPCENDPIVEAYKSGYSSGQHQGRLQGYLDLLKETQCRSMK